MKTAAKMTMTALVTVLGVGLSVQPASAQGVSVSLPGAEVSVPGPSNTTPPATTQGSSVKASLDAIKVAEPVSHSSSSSENKAQSKSAKKEDEKKDDMPAASPKVPESVKNVVEKLNDATNDITIESLNSAREAVIKLDVLIDIEKRLNDLTKIRKEREERTEDISQALPQAAFTPPPAYQDNMPPSLVPPVPAFVPPMATDLEVTRISGSVGRYSAQIKSPDGTVKNVVAGDKLADGSTVEGISRQGVTIRMTDKKTKTFQVKDVYAVFGGR